MHLDEVSRILSNPRRKNDFRKELNLEQLIKVLKDVWDEGETSDPKEIVQKILSALPEGVR